MRIVTVSLAALLCVTFASPGRAITIWDNGGPVLSGSGRAGYSSELEEGQAGDNFNVATIQTATQVQWWGIYSPTFTATAPDDFTIRFFTITAGVPAIVPFAQYRVGDVGRVDTGLSFDFGPLFVYSATIPNTVLGPGDYLLSILDHTAADPDDSFNWVTSNRTSGNAVDRATDVTPWGNRFGPAELAFNISGLDGAVPGPGGAVPSGGNTAMFFAMGLAGVIVLRRGALFSHRR